MSEERLAKLERKQAVRRVLELMANDGCRHNGSCSRCNGKVTPWATDMSPRWCDRCEAVYHKLLAEMVAFDREDQELVGIEVWGHSPPDAAP